MLFLARQRQTPKLGHTEKSEFFWEWEKESEVEPGLSMSQSPRKRDGLVGLLAHLSSQKSLKPVRLGGPTPSSTE